MSDDDKEGEKEGEKVWRHIPPRFLTVTPDGSAPSQREDWQTRTKAPTEPEFNYSQILALSNCFAQYAEIPKKPSTDTPYKGTDFLTTPACLTANERGWENRCGGETFPQINQLIYKQIMRSFHKNLRNNSDGSNTLMPSELYKYLPELPCTLSELTARLSMAKEEVSRNAEQWRMDGLLTLKNHFDSYTKNRGDDSLTKEQFQAQILPVDEINKMAELVEQQLLASVQQTKAIGTAQGNAI